MQEDVTKLALFHKPQESVEVLEGGMDTGGADQTHQVNAAAVGTGPFDRGSESLVGEKGSIGNGHVDARKVLVDDATGADIEVTDFGIAWLTERQADRLAGSLESGGGIAGEELVVKRSLGASDGVTGTWRSDSPPVDYDEDHRAIFRKSELHWRPPS